MKDETQSFIKPIPDGANFTHESTLRYQIKPQFPRLVQFNSDRSVNAAASSGWTERIFSSWMRLLAEL